ncbi:hypothetical protein FB45DRAFT_1063754 [Roridomyces roridus]|uniref:DUF6593 domain-containing protein n=1 Tax=Roridomyces roridus TaxID=1738132 RepID=A0AAD7BD74_9AGAR|nr:hypothetical protein FB45DRAFT_1063754 [Roridomyces roridus]
MPSFVFQKGSLLNTKIRLSSTSDEYEIHTRLPGSSTQLFRLDSESKSEAEAAHRTPVASINRNMFLPDTVSFSGKTERISKWFKQGTLDGSPASILHLSDSESPTFLADHDEYNLALFLPDKKTILAHWQPPRSESPHELILVISPDVDAKNYIEILLAFLYQTEKLRARTTPIDMTTARSAGVGSGIGAH